MATSSEGGKRPVFSRRDGSVEVAVFEWPAEKGRVLHTSKLTYSFRRKDSDKWEVSEYLPTSELLAAAKLLSDAHSAIQDRLEKARGLEREPVAS